MAFYQEYTIADYLESKTDLAARCDAIDAIIDQGLLLLASNVGGQGGNIAMYELDDGQVRIKTGYRSITEVSAGIDALEKLRNRYLNRLRGRTTVLMDKSVLRGGGLGWPY